MEKAKAKALKEQKMKVKLNKHHIMTIPTYGAAQRAVRKISILTTALADAK